MGRRTVESILAELSDLARTPEASDLVPKLVDALAAKSNLVAAKAASVAERLGRRELVPRLVAMFDRFLADPVATDKGCVAKTAAVKALYELGDPSGESVFLAGIRHVQKEKGYGPPVDTAAELRGLCGLGLLRIGYAEAVSRLADLLADPEPQVRSFAALGLGNTGREDAALLLRFKLSVGDPELDVVSECMAAFSRLDPVQAVPVLARFLEREDRDLRQAAVFALGETRQAAAFSTFQRHWIGERSAEVRRAILIGAACLRLPEAIDWLIARVATERADSAVAAVEALAVFRTDAAVAARVREAARPREESAVRSAVDKGFPAPP